MPGTDSMKTLRRMGLFFIDAQKIGAGNWLALQALTPFSNTVKLPKKEIRVNLGVTMKTQYAIFSTPLGWAAVVGHEKGIQRIFLPGLARVTLRKKILDLFPGAVEGAESVGKAQQELEEYFLGNRNRFLFALDLSQATHFQRKVYRIMAKVPKGEVRTYAWLAKKIGKPKALRAVGGANAKNRWPIVIP